jgi:hypothetical protein
MSIFLDLRTAIPLAGSLATYFYFHPGLPIEISFAFWGIFAFFYFLDARITVYNSHLIEYEKNIIFPALYKRYGSKISTIIQCGIEVIITILLPFFFITKIGFIDSSIVALVFAVSHLLGYFSNKKIIDSMKYP